MLKTKMKQTTSGEETVEARAACEYGAGTGFHVDHSYTPVGQ